ncbi:MAG: hypothetical protein LLF87_05510 [Eubacteriales bacterium]|nr:hypothetical protein [Eubacteriales bacterium]
MICPNERSTRRFLYAAMALLLAPLLLGGCKAKSIELAGDVKENFLTVYGTYDYEGRYTAWLKGIEEAAANKSDEKLRSDQQEYYACIRDYVSDDYYQTMVANRAIRNYETLAYENGYSYRTDGFEFEEYAKDADKTTYSFVAHLILIDPDGIEQSGTVEGQITVNEKDGLISNFYLSPVGFTADAS